MVIDKINPFPDYEERIYNILLQETKNIKQLVNSKDRQIINDYFLFHKGIDISKKKELSSSDLKAFINWRDRKSYQLRDLNILFSKAGINAPYEAIFASNGAIIKHKESNYITYMSIKTAEKLGDIFRKQYNWSDADEKEIYFPVMFHITTCTLLCYCIGYNERAEAFYQHFRILTYKNNELYFLGEKAYKILYSDEKRGFMKYCKNLTQENVLKSVLESNYLDLDAYSEISDLFKNEYLFRLFPKYKTIIDKKIKENEKRKSSTIHYRSIPLRKDIKESKDSQKLSLNELILQKKMQLREDLIYEEIHNQF